MIIETENLHIRDAGAYWAVGGHAINWDTPATVVDINPTTGELSKPYQEEFAPGSIMMPAEGVKLRDDHGYDVGLLTRSETDDRGWKIEMQIDKTPEGARVRQEIKDGKKHSFSIGFTESPLETTFDAIRNVYRRTKALVKEISVTGAPQHLETGVAYVRSNPIQETKKMNLDPENPTPPEQPAPPVAPVPPTQPDTTNLITRSQHEDALRDLRGEIQEELRTRSTPQIDHRSPGEVMQALAQGDKNTIQRYENLLKRSYSEKIAAMESLKTRAFPTEGIMASSVVLDSWVGDLTKLVTEPAIMLNAFSTGALPNTGKFIEYGVLKSDNTIVDTQDAEGDALDYGYVEIESKTAEVKTYGGYSELSRQSIERSSVAYLDTLLRAMALRAGKRINAVTRTTLETALAAQVTASRKVSITDETSWEEITDGLIDGADLLLDEGLTADYLITDKASFKTLKNMVASDGRPTMNLDGPGVNNVGAINLGALSGRLAGINVICDPNWVYNPASTPTNNMALVNKDAIRFRSSGITQLTDEDIVHLSKQFALYFYATIAIEIPKGVVPIELTL